MSARQFTDAQMKRYFSKGSSFNYAIVACIVGIILIIFGLTVHPLTFAIISLIGLLLLVIGGGTAVVVNRMAKPTDKEYDEWLEEKVDEMIPEALDKFRLDKNDISGQTLTVHSFVLPGTADANRYPGEILWKKGKDGVWRFSKNVYTFFFPTEDYLAVFITSIDALHQSTHIYTNATYFYRDIVSVEAGNVHSIVDFDGQKTEYLLETFSLKLVNGGSIGIGASFSAIPVDRRQKTPTFTTTGLNVDQTVANLRLLIHSKKSTGV